ncbi:MAG: metal ABC transporter ATP-binding protein [Phycisphaerales bacterium]
MKDQAPVPTPAVEFENVSYTYPGGSGGGGGAAYGAESTGGDRDLPALEDVSLTVAEGERLGVLGPNGGGKSTFLKLLMGVLVPGFGRVRVFGDPPSEARRRGLVGYVAQRPDAALAMPLSVREVVRLAATWDRPPWSGLTRDEAAWLESLLELVGIAGLAERHIGSLSGGQLQRALIARALFPKPRILVLDEPTVGIDTVGQRQFADLLDRVHAQLRPTMIVVSHDLRAITASSDRVACLARRLHSHTAPAGLTPEVIAEVFSHDVVGLGARGSGGAALHIHAHAAADCPQCDHPPAQGTASGTGAAP